MAEEIDLKILDDRHLRLTCLILAVKNLKGYDDELLRAANCFYEFVADAKVPPIALPEEKEPKDPETKLEE